MQLENLYYIIAGVAYGIFIVKFILSMILGDTDSDVDIDGDAEADFDVSSLLSFKGLIHFCMGCFGWIAGTQYLSREIHWYDWFIAIVLGIAFVFILYWVYKLCTKFQHIPSDPHSESLRSQLFGREGVVKVITDDSVFVHIPACGEMATIACENSRKVALTSGQKVVILGYNEETKLYKI